jgi:hypothetical protein
LTKLIREAKFLYHQNILRELKNNSSKLWAHINSLIKPRACNDIPLAANTLNDFFTSVFQQAPKFDSKAGHTISNSTFVKHSMFLTPVSYQEVFSVVCLLLNFGSLCA